MSDASAVENGLEKCRWCGALHGPLCPYVKALEFDSLGVVKRVEFFAPVGSPVPIGADERGTRFFWPLHATPDCGSGI